MIRWTLGVVILFAVLHGGPSRARDEARDPSSAEDWLGIRREELKEKEESLLRRPDERRPSVQMTVHLWDRPLTVGWNYELRSFYEANVPDKRRRLDLNFDGLTDTDYSRIDDRYILRQSLRLDFFYRITEELSVYLKGKSFYRTRWSSIDLDCIPPQINCVLDPDESQRDRQRERGFERDEMWIYASSLAGSPLSLQVGRQRVSDDREWWWDDDLDAVRLHYDLEDVHLEAGIAQLLWRTSTEEDFLDPEEEDVLRVFGSATWEWAKKNRLEFFFLHQNDRSETHHCPPGLGPCGVGVPGAEIIDIDLEDESDANLTWIGLSARGRFGRRDTGRIYYWADGAFVDGRETFLDYTSGFASCGVLTPILPPWSGSEPVSFRCINESVRHGVRGWGFDVGATWETPLPGGPSLTLGYAIGSGDSSGKDPTMSDDFQEARDRSFRQTGLQDNNAKFRGVDRFRYYGELLDPELSNLRVGTAAIGFTFWNESSVEILYHWYRQDRAAKFLRDATIRRQPAGRKKSIGHEIDLVVGIEEWEHIEIELVGAAFRAGSAYGDDIANDVEAIEGDWSYLALLKFELNY